MANLDNVLQQLREEHKQAQGAVEKLRQAISTIESLNHGRRCSAKENNVSSGKEKNCPGSKSQMGETQKAISTGKCQALQLRIAKDLSRGSEANRCSRKSKMGASEGPANEESSIVTEEVRRRGPASS